MRLNRTAEVVTALSFQGNWVKVLQTRFTESGTASLLGMKARQVAGSSEEELASVLKELTAKLPVPPKEVMGLLSTAEIVTRYLTLPSENPEELRAMALYQLEGFLPFPIQECVTAVKILGPVGEATRLLVAAAHQSNVQRLIRICRLAGLNLTEIASTSEAIGQWHKACWPKTAEAPPDVWLIAEFTREGLDLGVLIKGALVYMRQVPHPAVDLEGLAEQLRETIRAYDREEIGPPIQQVTLSGWLEQFGSVPLERLETILELPIRRIDPLEASPFRESLSVTAQELVPEVSFSELLGAACAPRLLELDLLPLEVRRQRDRQLLFHELRLTGLLCSLALVLFLGWSGTKVGTTWWQLRQTQGQVHQLEPQVARIKGMVDTVGTVLRAREEYAIQIESLAGAVQPLSAAMALQFLEVEGDQALVIRGTAPDFNQLSHYSGALREEGIWEEVVLRSAKRQVVEGTSGVEFELRLKLKLAGKRSRP